MVRLRLISLVIAAVVCSTLIYMAVMHKFNAITDLFQDSSAVKVEVEEKKPPPPPPPPPPLTPPPPPPPEQRVPPPMNDAPPTPTPDPVAENPPAAPPSPVLTGYVWLQRPSGQDFNRYYPRRASNMNVEGSATLDCIVSASGQISCTVASESPQGWGFGEAAIQISRNFRMAAQTADGRPTSGGRVRVPIHFQLAGGN
jgi:protein TonB